MIYSNLPRQTVKQYFKALSLLHFALASAAALYLFTAYALVSKGKFMKEPLMPGLYLYCIPFFATGSIIAGVYLYRKQVNEVKRFQNLGVKLKAYRTAFIKRDAFFQGPALFSIMAYMLTGAIMLLSIAVILIIAFFFLRPSKDGLIKELELSTQEIIIIQNDDAIIE